MQKCLFFSILILLALLQELKQFLSVGMNQAIEDNLNYLKIDVLAENIDQQAEETTECIK